MIDNMKTDNLKSFLSLNIVLLLLSIIFAVFPLNAHGEVYNIGYEKSYATVNVVCYVPEPEREVMIPKVKTDKYVIAHLENGVIIDAELVNNSPS